MAQKTDKYRVINTKVTPEAYDKIHRLARKLGTKPYEMLQMCVDTLVRYMDDRHNLSPEMERMMLVFEDMVGWPQALNLADPSAKASITEATYYLTAKGKAGARAVHVQKPFFGNWHETENIQLVLERTLELIAPELYRRLRSLCVAYETKSILELLNRMVDAQAIMDLNHEEVRRTFEDCNRGENTKPVEYGQRTRRKKHYTPDTMPDAAPTILFSPDDVPDNLGDPTGQEEDHHHTFDPYDDPIGY